MILDINLILIIYLFVIEVLIVEISINSNPRATDKRPYYDSMRWIHNARYKERWCIIAALSR